MGVSANAECCRGELGTRTSENQLIKSSYHLLKRCVIDAATGIEIIKVLRLLHSSRMNDRLLGLAQAA